MESPQPQLSIDISEEDWISSVKSKAEATSSSPSGCHIGHYKADLQRPEVNDFHLRTINFARRFTRLLDDILLSLLYV
jgi:hypothetical protein